MEESFSTGVQTQNLKPEQADTFKKENNLGTIYMYQANSGSIYSRICKIDISQHKKKLKMYNPSTTNKSGNKQIGKQK